VKLRSRLAAAAVVLVAAVAVGGWFTIHSVRESQRDQVDRELAAAVPTAFGVGDPSRPRPPVRDENFSDVYVARIEADGSRLELATPQGGSDAAPELPSGVSGGPIGYHVETVGSVPGTGGHRWRAVLLGSADRGPRLLVAVSLQQADATTARLQWAVVGVAVGTLAALGLAGWWIVRLGLRPIAEVTAAADAITAGERHTRVRVGDARTEAGHLGRAFNVMLDEHQAVEDRLRRFVADASHELRTPVASIRAFADLHRQGGLDSPDALADAMRRIGGESARMADLVDDLLLLARLDEGRPLEREPVDLAGILHDAALDVSVTHPSRVVDIDVDEPLGVVGDDARLRQVVTNLVHNALRHAGPDARITIHGHQRGEVCVVEVADDGIGLDADGTAHAFDRFWRAEKSRVRTGSGAGLGLSIVRAIVDAHGGRVVLESAPGAGTTVRLALPSVPAPLGPPLAPPAATPSPRGVPDAVGAET
jgi:two-component system OmpR family sensor kinase